VNKTVKNRLFKALLIFLALIFIFFSAKSSYAKEEKQEESKVETETKTVYLGEAKAEYTLDLWHHSGDGGYWTIGNRGTDKARVKDDQLSEFDGIVTYLEEHYSEIAFEAAYPRQVKAALDKTSGDTSTLSWELANNGIDLNEIIYVEKREGTWGDSSFTVTAPAKYNLLSEPTYKVFIPSLTNYIPLINYTYGNNIYSMFKAGTTNQNAEGVQATGSFRNIRPNYPPNGTWLHPSYIASSAGKLYDLTICTANFINQSTLLV